MLAQEALFHLRFVKQSDVTKEVLESDYLDKKNITN